MLRFRRLTPVDGASCVALRIAAKLPEMLAQAGFAAAVHTQRDCRGKPLGRDEQRRQRRAKRIGFSAENGGFVFSYRRKAFAHRCVRQRRSMTSTSVAPSARAEKLSAMR